MALQLNPDTTDDYESKSLAEMRQMLFDELGFIDPLSNDNRTLAMIRTSIINRLGLAVALLVGNDSFATVLTDVYNACGFAALGTHPPGVDTLLTGFINEAQQTLFRRIEMDKGGVTLPVAGTISIDSNLVRQLAIGLSKAHYGQPDAQAYIAQSERYLSDLTQRTPPNIVGQVNAAVIDAHNTVLRRYEFGKSALGAPSFGTFILGNYASTAADNNQTIVDDQPVELLALANLKKKIGQADADELYKQYERYMQDVFARQPPNATTIVNRTLKMTQEQLYRKYSVFRMERWYTWSIIAGQRFYGTFGDDNAKSVAPTALTAATSGSVVSHNMSVARDYHSSQMLASGKVLVMGGQNIYTGPDPTVKNPGQVLASSEIYDPALGTFAQTGAMLSARAQIKNCSVRLEDGRVFVAGGFNGAVLSSAEIYDPTSGTWSSAGNMTTPRRFHTCTLLADGTVLIVGGQGQGVAALLASAEVYDPRNGTFTAVGSIANARDFHTATILADGRVLIAGGLGTSAATTYIYDPVAKTFSSGPSLSSVRSSCTATTLPNGWILIAGGSTSGSNLGRVNTADLFDPNSNTITPTANTMTIVRQEHQANLLNNGLVLITGDMNGSTAAELYDPVADTFTATTGAMPVGVSLAASELLEDGTGRILIAGGETATAAVNTAMLYDPVTNTFSPTGNLLQGTDYYVVTAITSNGESLPSSEVFINAVAANISVKVSWTPVAKQPFVTGFKVYRGKTSMNEGYIATVPATQTSYIDEGTIPQGAAPPTVNNTAGPGRIDPRHVTWVGLSFNDNVWNPLIKGIPPMAFAQNINGVPTNYEVRQSLEIWPAPTTTDWKIQIRGYFEPMVFESDDDETTLDWQAIYFQALANVMPRFKRQNGQPMFNQLEIAQAQSVATEYIKRLVAGTHMTARYVPGAILQRNAVRPVLSGPYIGYP